MPRLPVIESELANFTASGPAIVAVLAGGTTGIGSYIASALAETYRDNGSKLRVYIVGRNAQRGEAVVAQARKVCAQGEWNFVKVDDLSLMKDVDRACDEIGKLEEKNPFAGGKARVDLLYMTYSSPVLSKQSATSEGVDTLMSTLYYSRIRFIIRLLPLLKASPIQGHAISVYAGNMDHGNVSPKEELPIGYPAPEVYGVNSVRKHISFMKTFLFEELAKRHAGSLRLSHIYPGLVDGPAFSNPELPRWFRITWRVMYPVARLYMTSAEDCGKVMLYLATSHFPARDVKANGGDVVKSTTGDVGGGAYAAGQRADVGKKVPAYASVRIASVTDRVWEHTMGILDSIP